MESSTCLLLQDSFEPLYTVFYMIVRKQQSLRSWFGLQIPVQIPVCWYLSPSTETPLYNLQGPKCNIPEPDPKGRSLSRRLLVRPRTGLTLFSAVFYITYRVTPPYPLNTKDWGTWTSVSTSSSSWAMSSFNSSRERYSEATESCRHAARRDARLASKHFSHE